MIKIREARLPFLRFFVGRKGLEAIWFIIIAAVIALVIAVILLFMFTDKSNKLETGLLDCLSKGGQCLSEEECKNSETGGSPSAAFTCDSKDPSKPVCCFGAKKK